MSSIPQENSSVVVDNEECTRISISEEVKSNGIKLNNNLNEKDNDNYSIDQKYPKINNRNTWVNEKYNEAFEEYYKHQNIIPSEEWDEFYNCLKSPLNSAFRIVKNNLLTDYILNYVRNVMESLKREDNSPCLSEIHWLGDNFVFDIKVKRAILRKNELFRTFHQFLIEQSENGLIFRQELVSMIPVLFLDIRSDSYVLDFCSAPGSKTSQILEKMHNDSLNSMPSGVVVANDADLKRANMMMHRLKHLYTPSLIVTNHQAQSFPLLFSKETGEKIYFDSVLCDVPCTSDGTLRKSENLWARWKPSRAIETHSHQLSILLRGVELCKIGGTIVYSTCSFNPIENEAVISACLETYKDSVELLDVSHIFPNLKRREGLNTWGLFWKNQWYNSFDEFLKDKKNKENSLKVLRSMFPPDEDTEIYLKLRRCMRFLPHDLDAGGFFVAVLKKTNFVRNESRASNLGDYISSLHILKKFDPSNVNVISGFLSDDEYSDTYFTNSTISPVKLSTDSDRKKDFEDSHVVEETSPRNNNDSEVLEEKIDRIVRCQSIYTNLKEFSRDKTLRREIETQKNSGIESFTVSEGENQWENNILDRIISAYQLKTYSLKYNSEFNQNLTLEDLIFFTLTKDSCQSPNKLRLTTLGARKILTGLCCSNRLKVVNAGCIVFEGKKLGKYRVTYGGCICLMNFIKYDKSLVEEVSESKSRENVKNSGECDYAEDKVSLVHNISRSTVLEILTLMKRNPKNTRVSLGDLSESSLDELRFVKSQSPNLLILELNSATNIPGGKIPVPCWKGLNNIDIMLPTCLRTIYSNIISSDNPSQ